MLAVTYGVRWDNYIGDGNKYLATLRNWDRYISKYTESECMAAYELLRETCPEYHPTVFQFDKLCYTVRKNAEPSFQMPLVEHKIVKRTMVKELAKFEKMSLAEKLEYMPKDLHHFYVDKNGKEIKR